MRESKRGSTPPGSRQICARTPDSIRGYSNCCPPGNARGHRRRNEGVQRTFEERRMKEGRHLTADGARVKDATKTPRGADRTRTSANESGGVLEPERCSRTAAVSAAHAVQTGWPCVFSAIQTVHRKVNQKRGGRIVLADCPRREPPRRRRSADCIVPAKRGGGAHIPPLTIFPER